MTSQLESLCEKKGIRVEFISNKFIDGDSEGNNREAVIKVHKIFSQCSMKVATAVVEIFTGEGNTHECVEIIEGYLKDKFGPVGIKIRPPKVVVKRTVDEGVSTGHKEIKENYNSVKELYIEANISSINAINIKGKEKKIKNNETLEIKENDIVELDIVVKPPIT